MESSGHDSGGSRTSSNARPRAAHQQQQQQQQHTRTGSGSRLGVDSGLAPPPSFLSSSAPRSSAQRASAQGKANGEGVNNNNQQQVTRGGLSIPLVSLKDIVTSAGRSPAASKGGGSGRTGGNGTQHHHGPRGGSGSQDGRDIASRTRRGGDKGDAAKRQPGTSSRSSASAATTEDTSDSKRTSKNAHPQPAAERGSKQPFKAHTLPHSTSSRSVGDAEGKHKIAANANGTTTNSSNNNNNSNGNVRAKNKPLASVAESQDTPKSGRSPGRLKKSVSVDVAGKDSTFAQQVLSSSSSSKTTPRAKKKVPRGRTVHDSSEFGLDVKGDPPPARGGDFVNGDSGRGGDAKRKEGGGGKGGVRDTNDATIAAKTSGGLTSPTRDATAAHRDRALLDVRHDAGTVETTSQRTSPGVESHRQSFPAPPRAAANPSAVVSQQPRPQSQIQTQPYVVPQPQSQPAHHSRASAFHVQLVPELSQQSSFFSLNKAPSRSSTSSDVQSEVCVDLPDYSDIPAAVQDASPPLERRRGGSGLGGGGGPGRRLTLAFPSAPIQKVEPVGARVRRRGARCASALGTGLVLAVSLLLFLPVLLLVIVLVPVCLFGKWFVSLCCFCGPAWWGRCCIGCCHTHLTAPERVWITKGPNGGGGRLSPVAQCVIVLQKGLSTERLRHLVDARLLSLENRHGRLVYPRFTQRVEEFCCGYAWTRDRQFSLNSHVFNMPGYIESLEDLQDHIAKMAAEPIPLSRPLWEVQVLHNFREPRDTVLLLRLHLAVADGTSMVRVLQNALVDTQKLASPKATFGVEAANMSPIKAFFLGTVTFCRRYLCLKNDFNLLHGPHVRPRGEMAVAWSEPFSLSAAIRVKQVARCTLSELLVSVVAGNIRTYMQISGIRNPYNIQCALPVDFRSDYFPSSAGSPGAATASTEIGNHYSMAVLPLPTNIEGAIPRLWETKQRIEQFKSSPEAAVVRGAQWFSSCVLPVAGFQRLWQKIYSRCTLVVSNLAGPDASLKLDSREIKCMMYWMPPLQQVAITVSFLTYADQVRMAVICDRSVLPNPEVLTRDFIYKLETVSKLLAHRRIPGEQLNHRMESMHLLSSYTLDDLTADQIQLQMALVQQELHDMKFQLDSGSAHRITANDTQLCQRIEQLKERFRELLMHLRKRRAAEADNALILSEEDELFDSDSEKPGVGGGKQFRRRTMSISSKMSTTSVSSQMRPLSTASTSNLPSPSHPYPPPWPDTGSSDTDRLLSSSNGGTVSGPGSKKHGYNYRHRLSTMEEFEADESLIVTTDSRRYNTC